MTTCPTEQQIAAFADGALSADAREQIARHVDQCDACFDMAARVARLASGPTPAVNASLLAAGLKARPRPHWVTLALPAMSAAAAALMAIVWWTAADRHGTKPVQPEVLPRPSVLTDSPRSTTRETSLQLEQPRDGEVLHGPPEVRWTGLPEASSYEVQVTTSQGDLLWSRQVDGTQRSARIDATLPREQTCYVWVAAFLPEGRRITSNVVKVTVGAEP